MSKSHLSRRQFMNRSLATAGVVGGFAIGGTKSSGRVLGANDTIRLPWPGSTDEAAITSVSGSE